MASTSTGEPTSNIERTEFAAIATLLDPRFKEDGFYFRENAAHAVESLTNVVANHIDASRVGSSGSHDAVPTSSGVTELRSSTRRPDPGRSTTSFQPKVITIFSLQLVMRFFIVFVE